MKKVELNKKKKQDALLNTAYQLFIRKGIPEDLHLRYRK